MKEKYCDEVFAGGALTQAQRIIKHVVKCHSCPSCVTDWGRRRQAAATARKCEKIDAKKLTKAFDGAADGDTQQLPQRPLCYCATALLCAASQAAHE
jgi:hypothetical protein